MLTTLQLSKQTKERLDKMKIQSNETYESVIIRLIKSSEDDLPLSEETIKNIEEALEDVKKGRVYSSEEVKKRLGIR